MTSLFVYVLVRLKLLLCVSHCFKSTNISFSQKPCKLETNIILIWQRKKPRH